MEIARVHAKATKSLAVTESVVHEVKPQANLQDAPSENGGVLTSGAIRKYEFNQRVRICARWGS